MGDNQNYFKIIPTATCLLCASVFTPILVDDAVAAGTQGATAGNGLRYDYVELRFVDFEIDGGLDGDGLAFGGSYRLDQDIFLVGSYTSLESDARSFFGNNIDFSFLSFGAGYIIPHEKIDLSAQFAFVTADADPGDSETGFHLKFEGRTLLKPAIEVRGSFNYRDIDDSDTYLQVGADYFFDANLSAGVTMDLMGDFDQITFGARYYFR